VHCSGCYSSRAGWKKQRLQKSKLCASVVFHSPTFLFLRVCTAYSVDSCLLTNASASE
jgi:hypothetical protein